MSDRKRLGKLLAIMLHPNTPESEAVNAFLAVRRINPSTDTLSASLIDNLKASAPKLAKKQSTPPPSPADVPNFRNLWEELLKQSEQRTRQQQGGPFSGLGGGWF